MSAPSRYHAAIFGEHGLRLRRKARLLSCALGNHLVHHLRGGLARRVHSGTLLGNNSRCCLRSGVRHALRFCDLRVRCHGGGARVRTRFHDSHASFSLNLRHDNVAFPILGIHQVLDGKVILHVMLVRNVDGIPSRVIRLLTDTREARRALGPDWPEHVAIHPNS